MLAQTQSVSDLEPQVVAALIAASVAALAAILTLIGTVSTQRKTRAQLDDHRKEDQAALQRAQDMNHYQRQLDELYGAMLVLRATSKRQWDRLRAGQDPFRLLDEIENIWADASDLRRSIVRRILAINLRLAELIEEKTSLLTTIQPPDSFLQFLDHQRALADLWEMHKNDVDRSVPSFPRDLDDDIAEAIASIQGNLRAAEAIAPK